MSTNTTLILKIMNVVFWIVFIGLCIQTGAILISFCVSLFINPAGAKDLYLGLDLSHLYSFDKQAYIFLVSFIIALTAQKAYIAYLVVRIFHQFDFAKPFNERVSSLISQISHVALGTGVVALLANGYAKRVIEKGVSVPVTWESSEFLFLAGVIFIIAQVFRKGIEMQTENDLTI